MARNKDYLLELQREADEIASRSSGFTRSESEREAESKAYKRLENARKSGAGRGQSKASDYKRKARRD
jgi:hypothetical protein